jgi:hypothetical protein
VVSWVMIAVHAVLHVTSTSKACADMHAGCFQASIGAVQGPACNEALPQTTLCVPV